MENTSEIVAGLQELQNQVKYFHWQTKSYAQHQALAKVFDSITDLIDTFVETLMGKYGRPSTKGQKFEMFDLEDINMEEWTGGVCDLLISFSDVLDDVQDTDLLNLRDEMLQNFNQLKYLLTLKENMKKKKVIKLTEKKTETAIEQYQVNVKVYPSDGVWGPETEKKMNDADKKIFKACQDQYGDMMDKIVGGVSKFFGLED